jgi:hypothetical protein
MKNNEALVVLSDAIDLQRETVELLREALATLKATIEELKAARTSSPFVPTYTPVPALPYTGPNWIGTPIVPTISGGTGVSGTFTSAQGQGQGVFYSNTGNICGKN